jgi:NADH-quinone oxidoreductase subunit A
LLSPLDFLPFHCLSLCIIFLKAEGMLLEINTGLPSTAMNYLPIVIQLVFAAGFVATTMVATHWLGPKLNTTKKLKAFESGVKSVGNARQPFAIKYFLTAILFVLIDVEVIFLYPWAVNFFDLGITGLITMGLFMALLLVGFIYIIKSGALDWE